MRVFHYILFLLQLFYIPTVYADLMIIGHPDITISSLDVTEVTDIFLKRHAVFADGSSVIPVNRSASSDLRHHFEHEVMELSVNAIKNYWLKLRFKGIRPPLVQDSIDASILFVQRVEGAVTYIDSTTVPTGVKLLMRIKR